MPAHLDFVRQRERPGLHFQAVAWPPRLSAGRRESGSQGHLAWARRPWSPGTSPDFPQWLRHLLCDTGVALWRATSSWVQMFESQCEGLWSLLGAQEPLTNCSGGQRTRGSPCSVPGRPVYLSEPHLLLFLLQLPHSANGDWALFNFSKAQLSRGRF